MERFLYLPSGTRSDGSAHRRRCGPSAFQLILVLALVREWGPASVVGQNHVVPLECLNSVRGGQEKGRENELGQCCAPVAIRLTFKDPVVASVKARGKCRYCRYLASTGLEVSPRRPQCRPSVEEGQEVGVSS